MIRHIYIQHFQFSTHIPHNEHDTTNANVSASRPSCCHKELASPFKLVSEQSIKKLQPLSRQIAAPWSVLTPEILLQKISVPSWEKYEQTPPAASIPVKLCSCRQSIFRFDTLYSIQVLDI